MPAFHNSDYSRPLGLFSGHLETIYPAFFRKISNCPTPERKRINTPDGDFLDLDWVKTGSRKIVIVQHGLEGSSDRPYVTGMVKCFYDHGFDALAWSYRGCSGEMNLTKKFYHSGATDDLDWVVNEALPDYDEIFLVGFSLGGNLTLKYLGESDRHPKIKKAVAISAPLDLYAGVKALHSSRGLIYEKRFVRNLKKKVRLKEDKLPGSMNLELLAQVKTLYDFDDLYTAPLHGFLGAEDYYSKCSAKFFIPSIKVPTLVLSAINDPILSKESIDHRPFESLKHVTLETTNHGGHVGFAQNHPEGYYWSEERAVNFCLEN